MSQTNISSKNKVVVILGPTASGKSDVAIKLAKKYGGEIISADSRQVYKGMDIGSGKVIKDIHVPISNSEFRISKKNDEFFSEGIKHYLIDVADPNDDFNISHFKKMAEKAIQEILQKGKTPIICGGTGFWIDAVVNDTLLPEVPPNKELRAILEQKSVAELFEMLKNLDSDRASNIDAKNKVRLVRALEICTAIGKVPKTKNQKPKTAYDFLQIGIKTEREQLNAKIKKRLEERFAEGMIAEVENLQNPPAGGGVTWQRLEYFGLEYRWIARYLQNKISLAEMQGKLYFDSIHYAKRQMTWFQRNDKISWLKEYTEIEKAVAQFLK